MPLKMGARRRSLGDMPPETIAFTLALAGVTLSIFERPVSWPLNMASAALYAWVFADHRIYADAALQVFFVVVGGWGWWQWTRGTGAVAGAAVRIGRLGLRARAAVVAGWVAGWIVVALALQRFTDTDVAWLDAFPAVGSVIGQFLLGRKRIEAWWVWIGVNAVAVALFAYKGLALTAVLYGVFLGLALMGARRWARVPA